MLSGLLVGSKFLSSFCVFFVKFIFILFFAFDNKGEIWRNFFMTFFLIMLNHNLGWSLK